MNEIERRAQYSDNKIKEISLQLDDINIILGNKTCIYLTGSFGRGDASEDSDLDLFILCENEDSLNKLDEICLKAELINLTRRLKFPDFSGQGKYLKNHSCEKLIGTLGKPDDDKENTLTARLLLLLESKPLVGDEVYEKIIKEIIKKYWHDYQGHEEKFEPAFLTNDILRF